MVFIDKSTNAETSGISVNYPDSKVHGASKGPICGMSAPDGPHAGPMNIAISVVMHTGEMIL